MPLFFFSPVTRIGEARRRAPAALGRRPWGFGSGQGRGKRGSGMWGIDSPTHLGSGRGEGAGRREWAAVALVARGGGASAREERLEAAEVVAGMAGGSGSLL